ncbi:transposase [Sphingomonas sp. 2R-10]|uniref:transposase n=1 Tax=Sphingomonas sp. 2R-10 TaxID=3045148 RepID=UPI000F7A9F6C|nr:transposase [Sphingomonas sp. 2R-10]MDJ0276534.1 transposase [Sphingomonas sp. 2R-10]
MARLIDPGSGDAIGLDDLVELLAAAPVDVRDEDAFASLGPALARLGRNRDFLADLALAELKQRCRKQIDGNAYGAQVLLLRPPDGRFVLRANFWPAARDRALRAGGRAAFFYDLPHDHNFPFLTVGYHGPGYWSDDYRYDVTAIDGGAGEPAGLRHIGCSRLDRGKVLLYRMRDDVHVQLPPDAFSVSLNILGYDAAQPWLDQYRFDIRGNTIAQVLTSTPAEALVTLAVGTGLPGGLDLAEQFAVGHPCDRMRITAIDALVRSGPDPLATLHRAAGDCSRQVADHARRLLDQFDPDRMQLASAAG